MDWILFTIALALLIWIVAGVAQVYQLRQRVRVLERRLDTLQPCLDALNRSEEPDVVRGPPGGMW